MDVLVVRHAIAEDREKYRERSQESDDFRPLTSEGKKKMKVSAHAIWALFPKVSAVVTSPLTRAKQTADILYQDSWRSQKSLVTSDQLRPECSSREVFKLLSEFNLSGPPIVLVGHEPLLGEFIGTALCSDRDLALPLKKGGIAWIHLAEIAEGKGELKCFLKPSHLRSISAMINSSKGKKGRS